MAPEVLDKEHKINLRQLNTYWQDPWKAIFTLEKGEALVNLCRKITTGPFKYKDKGWQGEPINSAYAITDPNGASNDAYTTTPTDYVKCVS
ncbi:hypothetical protein Godav_006423 [Gossypium davidsonii]|uniref:Uncharacterized protein n=1 Tax=Gossypium davidsonii TaxID=34287 RepID=A0A7J8S3P6_GOSDV|nr:hypothetical protein [Gossypium davidsonii]